MHATKTSEPSLFALMLGGRAPGCRIELHDIAFAVGDTLESLYPQLLDQWFGQPEGLHVDAYLRLDQVDGWRVRLKKMPGSGPDRLWFVNIGGYLPGELAEHHGYAFVVGQGKAQVKQMARKTLLTGHEQVHKDDLFDVDDCLVLDGFAGWHVHLERDNLASTGTIRNGYFPIPLADIRAWKAGLSS